MRIIPNLLTPLVVAYALATALTAHAQTTWPLSGTHADYGIVKVITLADPGHRHYCRVHDLTPDLLVCGVGATRMPVVYRRDDIAAILTPVNHFGDHFLSTIGVAAAVTGLIAVSVLLTPAVGLVIIAVALTYGIYSAISPHPVWQTEEILYQRPNTPLTVKLRGQSIP